MYFAILEYLFESILYNHVLVSSLTTAENLPIADNTLAKRI